MSDRKGKGKGKKRTPSPPPKRDAKRRNTSSDESSDGSFEQPPLSPPSRLTREPGGLPRTGQCTGQCTGPRRLSPATFGLARDAAGFSGMNGMYSFVVADEQNKPSAAPTGAASAEAGPSHDGDVRAPIDVTVRTLNGPSTPVIVTTGTVEEFVDAALRALGLPAANSEWLPELLCSGRKLPASDGAASVHTLGLRSGDVVTLLPSMKAGRRIKRQDHGGEAIRVYVHCTYNQGVFACWIKTGQKIRTLRNYICGLLAAGDGTLEVSLIGELKIFGQGKFLPSNKTVTETGLTHDCLVHCVPRLGFVVLVGEKSKQKGFRANQSTLDASLVAANAIMAATLEPYMEAVATSVARHQANLRAGNNTAPATHPRDQTAR